MRTVFIRFVLLQLTLLPLVLAACASKDDGFSPVRAQEEPRLEAVSGDVHFRQENEGYVEAQELRLKARELGEQLVANLQDCSLQGTVALPVSFVNLNDFNETSSFGRLLAEQMFFELNQRGYPVREYRIDGAIRPSGRAGEFALAREFGKANVKNRNSVIVLGTYSRAEHAVFVNARLVRPTDGRVLRTASMVIDLNPTVDALVAQKSRNRNPVTASGGGSLGRACAAGGPTGGMAVRDFARATTPPPQPQKMTPFDYGQDVH